MNKHFFIKQLIILGVIGWAVSLGSTAWAFSISPTKYVITIDPGETRTLPIKVINTDSATVRIQPGVTGVTQDPTGRPIFGNNSDRAESWVGLAEPVEQLAPGTSATLRYTIHVPPEAAPGSHYVGLVAEEVPLLKGDGAIITGRLIALVAIQVAGTAHEKVVTQVSADTVVVNQPTVNLLIVLDNQGNIEVPLSGTLQVHSWFGHDQAATPIAFGNVLLAQATRQVSYHIALPSTWTSFIPLPAEKLRTDPSTPSQTITAFQSAFR